MSKYSLKAKNLKFVIAILIIDTIILLTIPSAGRTNLSLMLGNDWPLYLVQSGSIITIAALLINHLLSPDFKARIVFWRFWNALPGCRAFSRLVHQDPRIDIHALQIKLGSFPTTAKEQNALWYRLFKQHESNIAVKEAHQRFLFFRDIASMTVLVLVLLLLITYFDKMSIVTYKYAFALITGQYFLFMVATHKQQTVWFKTFLH